MAQGVGLQLSKIPRMRSLVDHATNDPEEQAGNDSVREHLQDRARHSNRMQGKHAQQYKAHVTDAGVANHKLEIPLDQRSQSPIHDPDHREQGEDLAP
ncbi:hypothetical protein SDC9_176359 [bioreactor metagenome]|uniref:Uncharacterized protein n=1 Tax=bioreactor metagenome TaxID=1076179 RepID=A0A645GY01_9ZZZZ